MLSTDVVEKIKELVNEACQREGCFLYDMEFMGSGKGRTLRVYIDGESEGVSIDQCAKVSRSLSLVLDVEDLVPGDAYDLEVSSPGVERPLKQLWHFEKALGQVVLVKTSAGIPGTESRKSPLKQVKGELLSVDSSQILIKDDSEAEWAVPMDIIHKAQTIFNFDGNKFKNKKTKTKKSKK